MLACVASAAEFSVKVIDQEPPPELAAPIRSLLQTRAVQVSENGRPALEVWLVNDLPLHAKPTSPAKALDAVKTATLLGAVRVPADRRDYRDDELRAGVYTLRLALQPQDGNHLGTSEFLYFGVLTSAKHDTTPGGIADYKTLVKASSRETSTDHPVILSLRPPSASGETPRILQPAPEHQSVLVKVPATAAGEKTVVLFEIVCEGRAKH